MSDRIEEISEDLEADFGKPYNVSEDNSRYMLSLIEENMIDGVINPDLQEPSLDAMATTTMAIYKYPNIPWRELSQKPAIKRGLTFIACNVCDHPEKVEDMFHRLMQKHYGGLTVKMCQAVLKIVKLMSKDMQPFTSLHEYILIADRYENIIVGLHNLIRPGKDRDAALFVLAAIEEGLIAADVPQNIIVDEFSLNKSGFSKYYRFYKEDYDMDPSQKKEFDSKLSKYKESLRAAIGYEIKTITECDEDGNESVCHKKVFHGRSLSRRNILSIIIAYFRALFRSR